MQAEAAFRIQKSDLQLRPIWHPRADRVKAHLLVCFLAFVLWKTLSHLCARAGLGDEPRRVLDELAQIRPVDVAMDTTTGLTTRKRCRAPQPTKLQATFPTDDALAKALYLAMEDITRKWTVRLPNWGQILRQLTIIFPGRVPEPI
jgi:hypothetical protein